MYIQYDNIVTYILELISFVLIIIILSGRREARGNLSWVLAVILFPLFGALAYIIFGNPRLRNIVEKRMKRYPFIDRSICRDKNCETDVGDLGRLITRVTGMLPVRCRNLHLISEAIRKYALLERDIQNAQDFILMEYYLFRDDVVGRRFAALLEKKAKEGVRIYFMVDGWGSMGLLFSPMLKKMQAAGIKTAVFHSPFRFRTAARLNFRNHRKIVVIDGKIAYTGGMNIGQEYKEWADAHLRFEGNAVNSVAGFFAEDWLFATGEDISDAVMLEYSTDCGDRTVHVIPSGPHQSTPMIYDSLFAAITQAKQYVDIITPYLVPNQPMMELLKNMAKQGIYVRIIVPGRNNHPIIAAAGRSYYEELIEAGVQIYEATDKMVHAKIINVDGKWATVGSANMDTRSFRLNFELNLMAYSDDFALEVVELTKNYLSLSERVSLEKVRKRPFFIRVFEGGCRTLSPVL
ncbi:cardiolipin synthase [Seleniivibrio woodruffii]|uniref:Cardiolipin synthase n=1 Tax=Seleniivibrio woodruffii TaxID=1078050 RepID=A0A4R1K8C7_9BACT|nr:cardiolipin synthase [Seleniivibrio woodruffii]TCK60555.1 cardiolipin synthetase 2 [Seleniivibrio woodruffii]TVZ36183.1 cardiolipin synthase [Seleniivibrio woodruffii]